MATFDRERREIVLRIVYDGAATAGKTANLRSLRACFPHHTDGAVYGPAETATGRTLYFDSLEVRSGQVDDWPLRCQVISVPGQLAFAERRYRLLRGVDAAVVVCESTPGGVRAARRAWTFLDRVLGSTAGDRVPVVFQANKQDLPGALAPAQVAALLGLGDAGAVVPASALHREGVRETFLVALDAARRAVRATLRGAGPEALGEPMACGRPLHDALLRDEGAELDPGLASALDAALGVVDPHEGPSSSPRPPGID